MSHLVIEGWTGPVPAGPAGRALLASVAPLLGAGIGRAVLGGQSSDAVWMLLGHPRAARIVADTLSGWSTPDGLSVTASVVDAWDVDALIEAAGVALAIWTASGFFGRAARDQYLASLSQMTTG